MLDHIIFSSVWVAEWPALWKELLKRLTICSLCSFTICNFSYFPFWLQRQNLGSDCSSHCILVTSKKVLMMVYF